MRSLCTTLCDDYADGAAVMIKSFLDNNPWYADDIVVICWGKLSEEQKRRIGSLSKKIVFLAACLASYGCLGLLGFKSRNGGLIVNRMS